MVVSYTALLIHNFSAMSANIGISSLRSKAKDLANRLSTHYQDLRPFPFRALPYRRIQVRLYTGFNNRKYPIDRTSALYSYLSRVQQTCSLRNQQHG